jgi:small subunit ribosomal protein S21
MLIVKFKEGESIDKILKIYKKKCDKTKLIRNFRKHQFYIKPSIKIREKVLKYKQRLIKK